MAICKYCNSEFSDERLEAGYDYCMVGDCANKGLAEKTAEFRKIYIPALLHKCNYFWTRRDQLQLLNVRSDLLAGHGDINDIRKDPCKKENNNNE